MTWNIQILYRYIPVVYSSPHARTCSIIASGCLRLNELLLLGLEVCKQLRCWWLPTTGFYSFRHFNRGSETGVRKWCKSNPFLFIIFVMIMGLAISLIIFLLWMVCLQTLDLRSLYFRGTITGLSLCQIQLCWMNSAYSSKAIAGPAFHLFGSLCTVPLK